MFWRSSSIKLYQPLFCGCNQGREKGSNLWRFTYRESTGSSRRRGGHDSSKEIHRFDSHRSKLQGPGQSGGQRGKGMPEILPSMSYAGKTWPLSQIKAYMLVVWTNILETQGDNWLDIPWRGTRRGIDKITARIVTREIHTLFSTEETKKSSSVKEDRSTVPFLKSEEPAQSKADHVGSSTWLLKMGRSCCWRSSWSIKEPNWTCRIIGVTQLFIEQLAGATLW